ncbi:MULTISPECIES: magnesium transporter [Corallincola]|uniref:Magnesium transporter MgtE n=3 Tax=Corallincola TaxID=1775176 RepID=A0A368NEM6_9GAMM|nr:MULTISPECIES: magnesium transporter [Corallincola]RCU49097.1 magnesium transporter [Corallincola holothuriorum]TAA47591.1 magnesium transporter [Corallincola spongiicola]TCI05273.1 magnesium transporter [Corallincola luteus]
MSDKVTREAQIARDVGIVEAGLDSGSLSNVRYLLNFSLPPADIADLIEASTPQERQVIWKLLKEKHRGEVLSELAEDVAGDFLENMAPKELAEVTADLDTDDIADILQQLPATLTAQVLHSMRAQDRQRVERVLGYSDDVAGGLMNTDTVSVRPHVTVKTALRYFRQLPALPQIFDSLLVVNTDDRLLGSVSVNSLLTADPSTEIKALMDEEPVSINVDMASMKVALLFEKRDLVSAPVVDGDGCLLGRITVDDIVDLYRDEAENHIMERAGMDAEQDTFAPVMKTQRRRAVWLSINLVAAFMAAAVIGLFEATIEQFVALAVLQPIVASMGGIAGNQSLAIMIRAQVLGQINRGNIGWLFSREVRAGLLNGVLFSVLVGVIAWFWFEHAALSWVIAMALVVNLFIAAVAGVLTPMLLQRFKIDPALAGGVLVTTLTDVGGFFTFLGLATIILVH